MVVVSTRRARRLRAGLALPRSTGPLVLLVREGRGVVGDACSQGVRGSRVASVGKDAEELALPLQSGWMARGALSHVMEHCIVAVRTVNAYTATRVAPRMVAGGGGGGGGA